MTVPAGWHTEPLGAIGQEIRESVRPSPAVPYELYSVPSFATGYPERVVGEQIGSSKRMVRPGDLLLCKINPRINRVWLVGPSNGAAQLASSEYLVLRVEDGEPDLARWLLWYLRSPAFRAWITSNVEGATGSHTRAKSPAILRQLVPVAPLPERTAILDVIEEQTTRLDAAVESLRQALGRLEHFKEAAFRSALGGSRPGSAPPREIPSTAVRDESQWTTLGEIAEIKSGVTKDSKREDQPGTVRVPYLRVANVQRGYLDLAEIKTIGVMPSVLEELRLKPGDILLNEGGDRDKLGRGWVWSGEIDPCIHQNHVFRARITRRDADPRFVSAYANTFGQSYFFSRGKQTTNLASINRTQLAGLPIPLPPPPVQLRIVDDVERTASIVSSMRREVTLGLARASALREELLEAAFSGRLNNLKGAA